MVMMIMHSDDVLILIICIVRTILFLFSNSLFHDNQQLITLHSM